MDKKEISEIKKQFTAKNEGVLDQLAICYVDTDKQQTMVGPETFLDLPEEISNKYLKIFQSALSGQIGKTLYNIDCRNEEPCVMEKLRKTSLKDAAVNADAFRQAALSYAAEDPFLIIAVHGNYDILSKSRDGSYNDSEDVYEFILLCVCPVKLAQSELQIDIPEVDIKERIRDWLIARPQNAVLYPAFNDRGPDMNHALYYAKKAEEKQDDFLWDMTAGSLKFTGKEEKQWLADALSQMNDGNPDFDKVKTVQENLKLFQTEAEKDGKDSIDKQQLTDLLAKSGYTREQIDVCGALYDSAIGRHYKLSLDNVMDKNDATIAGGQFELKVDPGNLEEISTEYINGRLYLAIPLTENKLQVNGTWTRTDMLIQQAKQNKN